MSAQEIPYSKFREMPAKKLFLDTNAVLAVVEHESATMGKRGTKNPNLMDLLNAARQRNSSLITTPLVLEEVFHVINRRAMVDACKRRGKTSEKQLRSEYPQDHSDARQWVQAYLIRTVASLDKQSVAVEAPVRPDQTTKAWGKEMLQAFQAQLSACAALGPMDAMHLVWGTLLECDAFVSTDSDIRSVPNLKVYVP
jgi:predicted nucleic acid-binding protein